MACKKAGRVSGGRAVPDERAVRGHGSTLTCRKLQPDSSPTMDRYTDRNGGDMERLNDSARQVVLAMLASVHDMTLATVRSDGYPQATTVSYSNDGLTLFIGIGPDGQKARSIRGNNKVSLTITPPYRDWNHIKGLSISGTAEFVADADEMQHAADCMLRRFPQIRSLATGTPSLPWQGAVFIKIVPQFISILDYEQGFGHTDLFAVA
jgi:nitroimidazol reductase NimA-like FMN-containing flavoprotein (pyridoxamine 5'-phosphate oxidase superfamily)